MGRFEDAMLEDSNYYRDHRTNAKTAFKGYDKNRSRITHNLFFDEEVEIEGKEYHICEDEFPVSFPTKMDVCWTCGGKGSYVNPAIDASGLSSDDLYDDPDFADDYWGGRYDVTCGTCHGNNTVPVVDEDSFEMKNKIIEVPIRDYDGNEIGETAKFTLMELYKRKIIYEYDNEIYERECRMERMMGC